MFDLLRKWAGSLKGGTVPEYFGDSLLKHPQEPAFLCAAVKPGMRVLEIGTWHGRTAAYMADACPEATILSIDVMTWPPLCANDVNWFKNRRPNMRLLVGTVQQLEAFGIGKFDMILVDADHSYHKVKPDLESALRLLAPGGRLFAHDHCEDYPGVVQAVSEVCPGWKIIRAGDGCSLVELLKP